MRGKKARALRQAAPLMPPALKQEMKQRIAVVAAARAEAVGQAKANRVRKQRAAHEEARKAIDAAYVQFEDSRAKIVAEFTSKAQTEAHAAKAA